MENSRGPALVFGTQDLPGTGPHGFIDCTLRSRSDSPRVQVSWSTKTPVLVRFVRCGITPGDVRFPSPNEPELAGRRMLFEHEDGRRWEIQVGVAANRTLVTALP